MRGQRRQKGAKGSEIAAHFGHERQILEIQSAKRAQPKWRVWKSGFFTASLGGIKRRATVKVISLDVSLAHNSKLRSEKITANDLLLIDQFRIRNWNGKEFDRDLLLKYDKWIVNEDRSVIFKGLGGGSFEIPVMYDLIYKDAKVHLWCGGGGDRAAAFVKHADGCYDVTVFVSGIHIPPEISREQESVLALLVEAFSVEYFGPSNSGKLTVQFNL